MTTPTLTRTRAELEAALAADDTARTDTARTDTARTGAARTDAATHDGTKQYRRAVVMTMGALHAGHLSLVEQARALADTVVVTIFVNPLQFAPAEDLSRYPRDLDGDVRLLTGPGLLRAGDVVFAPTPDVVYPDGDPVVRVSAGRIGAVLEGVARPTHLDGVLTVVLKLLHLTRPDVALYGEKDAQQLAAIRTMVRDLDVPVDVVGTPLVRDADGLALSSRNAYLTPEERDRALGLSRALRAGVERAGAGADEVRAAAGAELAASGMDDVDYVALVDPRTFDEVTSDATGEALLLLAARVGTTRLIDNTALTLGAPTGDTGADASREGAHA